MPSSYNGVRGSGFNRLTSTSKLVVESLKMENLFNLYNLYNLLQLIYVVYTFFSSPIRTYQKIIDLLSHKVFHELFIITRTPVILIRYLDKIFFYFLENNNTLINSIVSIVLIFPISNKKKIIIITSCNEEIRRF